MAGLVEVSSVAAAQKVLPDVLHLPRPGPPVVRKKRMTRAEATADPNTRTLDQVLAEQRAKRAKQAAAGGAG